MSICIVVILLMNVSCFELLQVRYVCESDGCKLTEAEDSHIKRDNVLVIKRTQQTMRAVDQRTGSERY